LLKSSLSNNKIGEGGEGLLRTASKETALNKKLQKICAYCGIPAMAVFFIGMAIMTFIPPLSPALSPDQVAEVYRTYTTQIRAGGVMVATSAMPAILFFAAVSMQLRALEGTGRPVLAYAQMIAGAANIQFFIMPGLLWCIAAFRPERNPEILSALNDIAWIVAILPWPITMVQMIICGLAILEHSERNPIFPRWVGFFNLWGAVTFLPGALLPFFKTGPFAWNGLLSFWVPGTIFGLWYIIMQITIVKAINREQAAPTDG
jgi:hypothetical protein